MTTEATITKKITLATIKSFIRKSPQLYIMPVSRFDGMTDGVESVKNSGFTIATRTTCMPKNTCGIDGAWFTTGSRNYFSEYDHGGFKGYVVDNCCGTFILANKTGK